MFRAQFPVTAMVAVRAQHFCKSDINISSQRPESECKIHDCLGKVCFKRSAWHHTWKSVAEAGVDSSAAFQCLNHETLLSHPVIPYFTAHLATFPVNEAGRQALVLLTVSAATTYAGAHTCTQVSLGNEE